MAMEKAIHALEMHQWLILLALLRLWGGSVLPKKPNTRLMFAVPFARFVVAAMILLPSIWIYWWQTGEFK